MLCSGHSGFRPGAGKPAPAGGHCTWLQLNLCDVKSSPGKHWNNIWSTGYDANYKDWLDWPGPPLAPGRRSASEREVPECLSASTTCTWKKEARSDSVCIRALQVACAAAWSALLPVPASPALLTVIVPLCWRDTQPSFCSAKRLVQPRKQGMFNENQPAHTTPSSLFLPACQARGESLLGCGQSHKTHQQVTKSRSPLEASGQSGIGGMLGKEVLQFHHVWMVGLWARTVGSISPAGSLSSFYRKCEENTFYGRYLSLPCTA